MGKSSFMSLGAALMIAAIPFAIAFAGKALAEPTASGISYTDIIVHECTSSSKSCSARFSMIPSPGTPVRMQNLSCTWTSATPLRRIELSESKGLKIIGIRHIGSNEFSEVSHVVNVPLYNTGSPMMFLAGTVPEVSFKLKSADTLSFTCTISGLFS
jgi:hypothetical protein